MLKKLLFVVGIFSISFSMEEALKIPNYRPIASLKSIASEAIIRQLIHDPNLLEKITDPKQFSSDLHDFIKSKLSSDLHSLLLHLLPYKHKTLVGHQGPITAVRLSKYCDYALTGSKDNTIRLWDLNEGTCIKIFEGHNAKITALEFNEEELIFASGSEDGNVKIWDIKTGGCIHNIEDLMVQDFAGMPQKWLYQIRTIEFSETFLIFKNNAYTAFWRLTESKLSSMYRNITNSSESKNYIIDSNIPTNHVFTPGSGLCIIKKGIDSKASVEIKSILSGHTENITCGKISHNEKLAITGSNLVAKLWDVETGECLHTFDNDMGDVTAVTFSRDNTIAYTVGCYGERRKQLKIWDVKTGELLDQKTFKISNRVPLNIIINNNEDYYIKFEDGTGCIISPSRSIIINNRIFMDEPFSLITLYGGGAVIYSPKYNTGCLLNFDIDTTISHACNARVQDNEIVALFGLDTNDCQLWTLVNNLSLEQFVFILQLQEKSKLEQPMEYDKLILKSFDPQQQIRLKKYFGLD